MGKDYFEAPKSFDNMSDIHHLPVILTEEERTTQLKAARAMLGKQLAEWNREWCAWLPEKRWGKAMDLVLKAYPGLTQEEITKYFNEHRGERLSVHLMPDEYYQGIHMIPENAKMLKAISFLYSSKSEEEGMTKLRLGNGVWAVDTTIAGKEYRIRQQNTKTNSVLSALAKEHWGIVGLTVMNEGSYRETNLFAWKPFGEKVWNLSTRQELEIFCEGFTPSQLSLEETIENA